MTDEEYDEYCENPPDCGNCRKNLSCDLVNDPEFEDDCCEWWEEE